MVYREYPPPAELRTSIVCTWTLEIRAGEQPHQQHVLPDGCSDIVWIGDEPPIVVGPMTGPAVSTRTDVTAVTGVRFRPEATAAVIGVPAHELTDRKIALDDLWSRHRHVVSAASERLWEQRTAAGRARAVQSLIASRRDRIALPDAVIQHAISWMTGPRHQPGSAGGAGSAHGVGAGAGASGVGELARAIGISERQLRRRFLTAVGYSPKIFQRIVRFQKLLALAKAHPSARLGDAAVAAGYADQAHMTREVGEFSGVTPSALLGKVDSALALYDLLHA